MQRNAIAIVESSQRRWRCSKGRPSSSLRAASGGGVQEERRAIAESRQRGHSECVSAALACRHSTQTPRGGWCGTKYRHCPRRDQLGAPPQGEAARRKGAGLPAVGRQHRLRENAGSGSDSLRGITELTKAGHQGNNRQPQCLSGSSAGNKFVVEVPGEVLLERVSACLITTAGRLQSPSSSTSAMGITRLKFQGQIDARSRVMTPDCNTDRGSDRLFNLLARHSNHQTKYAYHRDSIMYNF
jgi:hypothetical protein